MAKSKTEELEHLKDLINNISQEQTALQIQIEKIQAEIAETNRHDKLGPLGSDADAQRAELASLESQLAAMEIERLKNQDLLEKANEEVSLDSDVALEANSEEVNKENSVEDKNKEEANKKANEEAEAAVLAKKEEPLATEPEDLIADSDDEEKDETPKPTETKKDDEEDKLKEKEGTLARTMEAAAKFGEGPSLIGTAWDAAVNTKMGQAATEALSDAKDNAKEWAGSKVQVAKDYFKGNTSAPDAAPSDEPAPPNATPRFDKPEILGNETVKATNWDNKPEKKSAESPGIELSDMNMKPPADTSALKVGPDAAVSNNYDKALTAAAESRGAGKDSPALDSDKENLNTPQMGMGQGRS